MISRLPRKHQIFQGFQIAIACVVSGAWIGILPAHAVSQTTAQTPEESETTRLCPSPALSRVQSHRVASGETLESIAATYNLLPVTLLGMNPAIQGGSLSPGMTLRIPPFNGIEVAVSQGQTWQNLADTYQTRADILFEVNGCPATMPSQIFIPGVDWFPSVEAASTTDSEIADDDPLAGYPLSSDASVVANFGWQLHPEREELVFSSGVTLAANAGAIALAVGDGTVAYVGEEENLGTLIVINHAQGLQTRYARITNPQVKAGDRVSTGQEIATATSHSEEAASLYFEVRTNSVLGWVARDPGNYIPALAVR